MTYIKQPHNPLRIAIITARSGFPNGFGAASIIRKYGAGFVKLGYACDVLLMRPSEKKGENVFNQLKEGNFNNISFKYTCMSIYTSNNPFKRIALYFIGTINTLIYIFANHDQLKKVFFYSPDYIFSTILIQIACHLKRVPCVGIKTESSFCDIHRTQKFLWKTRERFIYKLFNNMVVITEHLKKQLLNFGYSKNIKVVPIIVDEDMYKNIPSTRKEKILIYMGTLDHEEELSALIESFSIITKSFPEWQLQIVGSFRNIKLEKKIHLDISNLNIKNKIIFTGKIPVDKIPYILSKGGVMLLPRIKEEYSQAGFPIKLGEYLLSGAPVVATKTGDINNYLKDGYNSFLVDPGNAEIFSKKVIDVIDNYSESLKVGKRGTLFAIEAFGSVNICKKLLGENSDL